MRPSMRMSGFTLLVAASLALIASFLADHAGAVPDQDAVDKRIRAYRFKAKVDSNGGITPISVGHMVTGEFTYDLDGRDRIPDNKECGHFLSAKNSLKVRIGNNEFAGVGDTLTTLAIFPRAEHFSVIAHDLRMPKGWAIQHGAGNGHFCEVLFQNAPSQKVFARSLPEKLSLPAFVGTRVFRMHFVNVQFPGGKVDGAATTVRAIVESLEEVRIDSK